MENKKSWKHSQHIHIKLSLLRNDYIVATAKDETYQNSHQI